MLENRCKTLIFEPQGFKQQQKLIQHLNIRGPRPPGTMKNNSKTMIFEPDAPKNNEISRFSRSEGLQEPQKTLKINVVVILGHPKQ